MSTWTRTTAKTAAAAIAIVCGALVASTAKVGAGQEPTFKVGNRTVAVYATVAGADGRLVPDLPRDVFSIYDNGKKQEITLFANDIQPITAVVLLDRSGSMLGNFELVERAAERFVDALQPGDKARIGSFSNRIELDPREFTSSHEELLSILRTDLQAEGPTPLWNAISVGITALLHEQGRRVILVFTDGMDNPANGAAKNNSLKDVMKRADEEDVMVYAIGLAPSLGPAAGGNGGGPGNGPGGFGGGRGGFGRGRGGFGGGRPPVADRPDDGLPKIATATGGGYFELTSTADLAATFTRIADELHHQYALGFAPMTLDNKLHDLDLRISREGLTARARRSYLARGPR